MAVASQFDPIFVHASARSGSTYFFSVLRRNESLLCFNEAIIDGKRDYERFKKARGQETVGSEGARKWDVNHHFLDRADYYEFIEAWDAVMHLCPEFPTFQGYLPDNGVLSEELSAYLSALMDYARSFGKRPVLCEVNSRGRAGALRSEFGGFHIAQYRDPLSQFGSFIRALIEGGTWGFLSHPVTELGTSATHALYRLVPEAWRAPDFHWLAETRAKRWGSDARYIAAVGSPRPETIEKLFRWHLFSWSLNNLAAISYSDLTLDIDKIHDDADYRADVVDRLAGEVGAVPDFSDVGKFVRYYDFETFDIAAVCDQVVSAIASASADGRLDEALRTLGRDPPVIPAAVAAELMLAKIRESMASMTTADRRYLTAKEWTTIANKNRKIWFNPGVRWLAERVYPLAHPFVQAARRAGISL